MPENNAENLWKSQGDEEQTKMTTEQIGAIARRHERTNILFYRGLLCLTPVLAAAYIRNLLVFKGPWLVAGFTWALLTVAYIVWRPLTSGPRRRSPEEPSRDYLLRELQGQRDWGITLQRASLLIVPAILAVWMGGGPEMRAKALGITNPLMLRLHQGIWPLAIFLPPLAFVWHSFGRQVRRLDSKIRKLSGL